MLIPVTSGCHRPDPKAGLNAAIVTAFDRAQGRYGHRRIHREVRTRGQRVAKKTVLNQMGTLGLSCQVRRKKRFTTDRGETGTAAPNRLNRVFTATAPHRAWVTDVTEFRIGTDPERIDADAKCRRLAQTTKSRS